MVLITIEQVKELLKKYNGKLLLNFKNAELSDINDTWYHLHPHDTPTGIPTRYGKSVVFRIYKYRNSEDYEMRYGSFDFYVTGYSEYHRFTATKHTKCEKIIAFAKAQATKE